MGGLSWTRAFAVLLMASGVASACGSSSEEGRSGSSSVWKPTTVAFDPTCKGCEEVGTVTLPHMGDAKLMRAPGVDDPEAQWVHCVNGILDCIEQGKDESACVGSSGCPGPCKSDYRARLDAMGKNDVDAKWAALRAVFESPTSRCAPPQPPVAEVTP